MHDFVLVSFRISPMKNLTANHPVIDYHIHTKASHDGMGTVEKYCIKAKESGYRELAFTNHLDLDPGLPHAKTYDHSLFAEEVRDAAGRHPDLTIRIGIEVTYQSALKKEIASVMDGIEADFIMGGIHIIGATENTISEEEGSRIYFRNKNSTKEAYAPYFEEVLHAVRFGHFDVIGHLDVIKRYGSSIIGQLRIGEFYGFLRRILEGMIKRDIVLEVNSSGLFHHVREVYPSLDIVKLYRELGGRRLTIGSDAHRPEDLGRGLDQVVELIRHAGFNELTLFEKRIPRQVKLP